MTKPSAAAAAMLALAMAGCAPIKFENPDPQPGHTLTCQWETGPNAGRTVYDPDGVPVPLGMACRSFEGYRGVGVRRPGSY